MIYTHILREQSKTKLKIETGNIIRRVEYIAGYSWYPMSNCSDSNGYRPLICIKGKLCE